MRIVGLLLALFVSAAAFAATAGAPLKGIDVRLGRSDGRMSAPGKTDAEGKLQLGVLPRGTYHLVIGDSEEPLLSITISGAASGPLTYRFDRKNGTIVFEREEQEAKKEQQKEGKKELQKIAFDSDGEHPITVAVTRAKSNITNN